ncbi:MAG: glycosyltransferase [Crocinitomicaceae bacterium]|nr:glycosyltransferase [Crocinitomicaceae bacterium]
MAKRMRILFLTSWYPNSEDDQIGNFVRQHALAVAKYCEVHVLASVQRDQNSLFEIDHKQIHENFSETIVYTKAPHTSVSAIDRFIKFRRYRQGLFEGYEKIEHRYGKPDITHLNVIYPAGLFALWLLKDHGIPFIITEHWTLFLDISPVDIKPWQLRLMRNVARQSLRICPVSESLEQAMKKHGLKGEYEVIPNSIDTNLFHFNPKHITDPNCIKFLHVSTLDETHKNFSGMIHAFRQLAETNNKFELTIVGEKLTPAQIKQIKNSGIEDKIQAKGVVPLSRVAELMQNHDAFVLFSNYETFSIVLAEALICGLPVITSNVDGVAQEVNDALGLVVPVKDIDKLTDALDHTIKNISNYNREEISQLFETKYSHEIVGEKFHDLYKTVLKK